MNSIALVGLVKKDVRLFLGNRRALVLAFALPIATGSFFGFLLGGKKKTETSKIAIEVVDLDGSLLSKAILGRVAAEKTLDVQEVDLEAARRAVQKGKSTAALVLPRGFGDQAGVAFFTGSEKPEITFLFDPSHEAEVGMLKGLWTQAAMEVVSKEMLSGAAGRDVLSVTLARLASSDMAVEQKSALEDLLRSADRMNAQTTTGRAPALSLPYELKEEAITSGEGTSYNGYAHSFAGMGVQSILFMGIDAGIALLTIRQSAMWQRLRAAPVGRRGILFARALSAALIALAIMLVLYAFARAVFQVRVEGSLVGLLGISAAFALMTAAFGLLIAALGKTPEAARGLATFGTLIMVMLGGAWIPAFLFPPWLQTATLLIPTRWAVDGLEAMTWRGLGIEAAVLPIVVLLGYAGLFGVVALWRFKFD